jgi:isochorismate hydrolase
LRNSPPCRLAPLCLMLTLCALGPAQTGPASRITQPAGSQIDPDLAVAQSDPVVIKKRYSAFFNTDLDQLLHRLRPDALILAGINTHACVRVTAIDAYQRDWKIVLAADCVDSYDREHHDVSMKYMKDKIVTVLSNQEIRLALAAKLNST